MRKKVIKVALTLVLILMLCSCTNNIVYKSENDSSNLAFESVYNASLQRVTLASWLVGSLNTEDLSDEELAYIQGYLAECLEADDNFTFSHAYADHNSIIVQDKEIHALINRYDDASWRYIKEMERLFLDMDVENYIDSEFIEKCREIHDAAYDLRPLSITDESTQSEALVKLGEVTELLEVAVEEISHMGSGNSYSRYTMFYPTGYDGTKFSEMDG